MDYISAEAGPMRCGRPKLEKWSRNSHEIALKGGQEKGSWKNTQNLMPRSAALQT
jgi:hypothetical protein